MCILIINCIVKMIDIFQILIVMKLCEQCQHFCALDCHVVDCQPQSCSDDGDGVHCFLSPHADTVYIFSTAGAGNVVVMDSSLTGWL